MVSSFGASHTSYEDRSIQNMKEINWEYITALLAIDHLNIEIYIICYSQSECLIKAISVG